LDAIGSDWLLTGEVDEEDGRPQHLQRRPHRGRPAMAVELGGQAVDCHRVPNEVR
jgi:hypothetical protein